MNTFTHKTRWFIGSCLVAGAAAVYLSSALTNSETAGTTTLLPPAPVKLLTAEVATATAETAPPAASAAREAQPVAANEPSPPIREVLKMVDSGVKPEVVKSYIQNSMVPFILGADDIVALNQRGVPSELIVAMLSRTGELRAQAAQAAGPQMMWVPASPPMGPETPMPYAPVQEAVYAPEPGYGGVPYPYYEPYPNYAYSSYPLYSTLWWSSWLAGYPGYYHGHAHPAFHNNYRNHGAVGGFRPAAQPVTRWADAYPNRIVTGPYYGANRGFNGRPAVTPFAARTGGVQGRPAVGTGAGAHGAFGHR